MPGNGDGMVILQRRPWVGARPSLSLGRGWPPTPRLPFRVEAARLRIWWPRRRGSRLPWAWVRGQNRARWMAASGAEDDREEAVSEIKLLTALDGQSRTGEGRGSRRARFNGSVGGSNSPGGLVGIPRVMRSDRPGRNCKSGRSTGVPCSGTPKLTMRDKSGYRASSTRRSGNARSPLRRDRMIDLGSLQSARTGCGSGGPAVSGRETTNLSGLSLPSRPGRPYFDPAIHRRAGRVMMA